MMKTGVALIGVGYWGSKLRRYIEENRNFELMYVCNSKSDLTKVWNNQKVSAIVVATPIDTHYQIVRDALLADKHVLSEKPLALKTEECLELKKLSKQRGLVLHIEYTYTFSKALKKARKIVESKDLGEVLAMEMFVRHLGRFGRWNVYWLLASHMLSVLDMFVSLDDLTFKFTDLLVNDGLVETGMIIFHSNRFNGYMFLSLNYPWKETKVTIYCEHGTLEYNPNTCFSLSTVTYKRKEWVVADELHKQQVDYKINEHHNLQHAIQSFHNCIVGKETPNIDMATKITKIIETGLKK